MSKKNKKTKKNSKSWWKVLLLILVAAFVVWYLYFDGRQTLSSLWDKSEEKFQETSLYKDYIKPELEETEPGAAEAGSTDSSTQLNDIKGYGEELKSASKIEGLEIPLCRGNSSAQNHEDHEIHEYNGFTLCYRESYEVAEWVAYTLTKEELIAVTGRSNKFKADSKISTGSATPADYTKTGYDRGHLAPAADLEWSVESMEDSFLMSNMTPQAPDFNRGLWKTLEEQVRTWADTFGEVTVVTGPVLEKDASQYKKIGTNEVSVPEYFYKALLAEKNGTKIAVAFILPNRKCEGNIWDYAVSVDELEKRTALDFFSLLPDSQEETLESVLKTEYWK